METNQPIDLTAVDTALARLQDTVESASTSPDMAEPAGTDLAISGVDTALALKERMALQARAAMNAQKAAMEQQAEVRGALEQARRQADAMISEARRREAEIMAKLAPILEQAKLAAEGIEALNLYLGRDEWVHTIREGAPAPASEPITIRQSVVAFDEETALRAEDGGIDHMNINEFDAWLLADPANVDQVVPEQKCVVAAIAKRALVFTGNPWEDNAQNKANHESWLIIRNGENLYRINISEEFTVGERLVPKADEFTSLFLARGRDGELEPLRPGTTEWVKAEKQANARTRHYMKIALCVQGLIDRAAYLRPLPGPVSVIEQASYDAGHVRVVTDGENAIDSGRAPFNDWLAEKLKMLRPGIRVVGHYPYRYEENPYGRRVSNVHPSTAHTPESMEVQTISRLDSDGQAVFTYDRTDSVWTEYGSRQARSKASYTIWKDTATVVPIDFVTEEELHYYLESRSERRHYVKMFPALRAALEVLSRERKEEAPFRALLSAELQKKFNSDAVDADRQTDELVRWWKVANKWNRALNGAPDDEAKAARVILKEATRRAKIAEAGGDDKIVEKLRADHDDVLVIARRTNDLVVVQRINRKWPCQDDKYRTKVAVENFFVRITVVKPSGDVVEVRDWQHLTRSAIAKWQVLWQDAAWEQWDINGSWASHLTDPEIDEVIEKALAFAAANGWTPISISLSEDSMYTLAIRGKLHYVDGHAPVAPAEGEELTGTYDKSFTSKSRDIGAREAGKFETNKYSHDENWTRPYRNHWRPDEPAPGTRMLAPWESDSERHRIVWVDEDAVEAARSAADEWNVADLRRSDLATEATKLFSAIEHGWLDREWERRRLRFIEDYGDASLWDDHKKAVTVHLPTDHRGAKRGAKPTSWAGLRAEITDAVQGRRDIRGLTVAEAFGAAAVKDWPDEIASLSFPAAAE
ncbi:ATP synthase subunit B family protein [Agromyces humi]|uniref:hypothetical protein n=1 Tax=Agromyces humi TaxID=1766800 RepID=UPI001357E3A7|nr:hypothetical protein [Agromyces humi]